MTQAAIAEQVGTSQGHISDIETGRRGKRLSFGLAQKLIDLRDKLRSTKKEKNNPPLGADAPATIAAKQAA